MTNSAIHHDRRRWLLAGAGAAVLTLSGAMAAAGVRPARGSLAAYGCDGTAPAGPTQTASILAGSPVEEIDRELNRWLLTPQAALTSMAPAAFGLQGRPLACAAFSIAERAHLSRALATPDALDAVQPGTAQVLDARTLRFDAHERALFDVRGRAVLRRSNADRLWVVLDRVERPADLVKWWAFGADVVVVPSNLDRWATDAEEVMRHAGVRSPEACRAAGLLVRA